MTVSDAGSPAVRGTLKKPVSVTAAAATALRVTSGSPATTGQKLKLTVAAVDPFGNVSPGYRGTVTLTSSDPTAVLPAAYSFTAMDGGKHVFNVTLNTAGLGGVTASDTTLTGTLPALLVAERTPTVVEQADPENGSNTAALVVIGARVQT